MIYGDESSRLPDVELWGQPLLHNLTLEEACVSAAARVDQSRRLIAVAATDCARDFRLMSDRVYKCWMKFDARYPINSYILYKILLAVTATGFRSHFRRR